MIRLVSFLVLFSICSMIYGQQNNKVSTIDFVQILDDNKMEVEYYYNNNWKVLREMAIKKGYIHSYQLLEVTYSDDAPFHLMLITTYLNHQQYDMREDHFTELIIERGPIKLMNNKEPDAFRKIIFSKEMVRYWN